MQAKRIAGNTAAMFVRQIGILGLNLYMIRTLLQTLGVEDFAIYSVVYSIIMMGACLWSSIQTITQRYFAFAIGEKNLEKAESFYDANIILCIIAAFLALLSFEVVGVWFVSEKMDVAPDRLAAALVLFRAFFVFALLNMFSMFYAAVIMAHEDMKLFALISILEAALRLGAAMALSFLPFDQLATFGVLFSAAAVLVTLSYAVTAIRRYPECHLRRSVFSADTLRDMLSFGGWTVFGQLTTISRIQMITILINQAFNPATVAARAISVSVGAQVLAFSNNFSAALNPPIVKSYAAGTYQEMYSLIHMGSKIAFFLVWMATLPLMATMPGILSLWLGDYPEQTVVFTRLSLLENAIVAISFPLMAAARAAGDMRLYELTLGTMQILVLVFAWILVSMGYPAISIYVVAIVINIAMFVARLVITSRKTGLPPMAYLKEVMAPVFLVVGLSSAATVVILRFVPQAAQLSLDATSLSAIALLYVLPILTVMTVGLSAGQKRAISHLVLKKFGMVAGKP